eukprot:CAMPEP_0113866742 /NCGR_PEP_ID=MMETSP0780_2-20120614/36_1 /TAXON_ID=652834 /ORGANISM="Palpitomonas bilix" /LENGTH=106 /DNA_ID=CAMNT_0000851615 /DNA_START=95 /DNA_END=415 /DNA_ORIENTATION=- /assembly_acc=CAM_ASM_000599
MNSRRVSAQEVKTGAVGVGQQVTFVGRVASVNEGSAVFEDANKETLKVWAGLGTNYTAGTVFEVVGAVMEDRSIKESRCISFGEDFDLENYGSTLKLLKAKGSEIM